MFFLNWSILDRNATVAIIWKQIDTENALSEYAVRVLNSTVSCKRIVADPYEASGTVN